jgi:hypothetical protein
MGGDYTSAPQSASNHGAEVKVAALDYQLSDSRFTAPSEREPDESIDPRTGRCAAGARPIRGRDLVAVAAEELSDLGNWTSARAATHRDRQGRAPTTAAPMDDGKPRRAITDVSVLDAGDGGPYMMSTCRVSVMSGNFGPSSVHFQPRLQSRPGPGGRDRDPSPRTILSPPSSAFGRAAALALPIRRSPARRRPVGYSRFR